MLYDGGMPLGTDYEGQDCSAARALEVVGERWTLLIVRDLFYGVRRYSDLRRHIGLPPATLTQRLAHLCEQGVVTRVPGTGARDEYQLTPKGEGLWPVLYALTQWGGSHYVADEARASYTHVACGERLAPNGSCPACGVTPPAADVVIRRPGALATDPVAEALREPHRLLTPLRV